MEESHSAQSGKPGKSTLQKYTLRSATKEKPPVPDLSNSSSSRRGRITSSVSKSVNVLDLSAKDKSAKPPRRLSIPNKSAASPAPRLLGSITPISDARMKRSGSSQERSDTPIPDVTRSASRKKFSALSSASYWLSQIKLSETVNKHSISLGFFKLALEAGSEPLQRMRDELKSYTRRYDLGELGEFVKELFERYNIIENTEQLQVSESFSQAPGEGTRSSDDDVGSFSSTGSQRKPKPSPLSNDTPQVSRVSSSIKKVNTTQGPNPPSRTKGSLTKSSANSRSFSETGTHKSLNKTQKPVKKESNKVKDMVKRRGKKSDGEEGPVSSSNAEKELQENKENMDASSMEIPLTEVK